MFEIDCADQRRDGRRISGAFCHFVQVERNNRAGNISNTYGQKLWVVLTKLQKRFGKAKKECRIRIDLQYPKQYDFNDTTIKVECIPINQGRKNDEQFTACVNCCGIIEGYQDEGDEMEK